MSFDLISLASDSIQKQALQEVIECNEYTEQFGLALTQIQALELLETRSLSLRNTGRIEFSDSATSKIIKEFCDSPYISMQNYLQTLHALVEMFYYYKNETMDSISDDDLINYMKVAFDGVCKGSLDFLSDHELYRLAKNLQIGLPADYSEDGSFEFEGDDNE